MWFGTAALSVATIVQIVWVIPDALSGLQGIQAAAKVLSPWLWKNSSIPFRDTLTDSTVTTLGMD